MQPAVHGPTAARDRPPNRAGCATQLTARPRCSATSATRRSHSVGTRCPGRRPLSRSACRADIRPPPNPPCSGFHTRETAGPFRPRCRSTRCTHAEPRTARRRSRWSRARPGLASRPHRRARPHRPRPVAPRWAVRHRRRRAPACWHRRPLESSENHSRPSPLGPGLPRGCSPPRTNASTAPGHDTRNHPAQWGTACVGVLHQLSRAHRRLAAGRHDDRGSVLGGRARSPSPA